MRDDDETRLLAKIRIQRQLLQNAKGREALPGGGRSRKQDATTIRRYQRELEDLERELAVLRLDK